MRAVLATQGRLTRSEERDGQGGDEAEDEQAFAVHRSNLTRRH